MLVSAFPWAKKSNSEGEREERRRRCRERRTDHDILPEGESKMRKTSHRPGWGARKWKLLSTKRLVAAAAPGLQGTCEWVGATARASWRLRQPQGPCHRMEICNQDAQTGGGAGCPWFRQGALLATWAIAFQAWGVAFPASWLKVSVSPLLFPPPQSASLGNCWCEPDACPACPTCPAKQVCLLLRSNES